MIRRSGEPVKGKAWLEKIGQWWCVCAKDFGRDDSHQVSEHKSLYGARMALSGYLHDASEVE